MVTTGMNLTEVRALAARLQQVAEQLRHVVSSVDGRVAHSTWHGPDADRFKHEWWPGHRSMLLRAADSIHGLGQSASNNADEQERASGAGSASGGAGASGPWAGALQASAALAGGGLAVAGQLAQGLDGQLKGFGRAHGLTEVLDWHFFDGAHAPVKGFIHDIAQDGKIKVLGKTLGFVSVAANTYGTIQDFGRGDYYGGTLDGIDTAVDPFKTKSPVAYLAVATTEIWTDVFRDARKVDWNLTNPVYTQYLNPFVAKNWTDTILPGLGEGLGEAFGQISEDLLP